MSGLVKYCKERKKKKNIFTFCVPDSMRLPYWYLHLSEVGELEYPSDPESYVAGSVATVGVTLGGQVEG